MSLTETIEIECLDCDAVWREVCTKEEYQQYLDHQNSFAFWPEKIKHLWLMDGWALKPYVRCNICYIENQ